MKKVLFSVFLALASCQQSVTTPKEQNLSAANVATIRQMFDAFNAHDWKKMTTFYANPYQALDPAFGMKHINQAHDEMLKHYSGLEAFSPDVKDSLILVEPVGKNKILVQFVSKGTMTEPKMPWSLPICSILTLENGKIIADETYYDNEK